MVSEGRERYRGCEENYISTCVIIEIAHAGEVEGECARDFLSIGQDGINVVVGAHIWQDELPIEEMAT